MEIEPVIIKRIIKILKKFKYKYLTKEGQLKRRIIIENLANYNIDLIEAILDDELLRRTYTKKINKVEIFELDRFVDMLKYKEYWQDSFTKFNNKIGLVAGNRYIDDSSDVVLDFPYKDCVLKAGMTKEDVMQSEEAYEPFLNEVIAKPEIDELFEPKIFHNVIKFSNKNQEKISSISNNDNLVIKGNNLIAMHSIESRYTNKIKFVYLDPPYNTGSDSFKYNDKFNQSSWLTFMKNRLEIIKELLREDGSIYVSIDENEYAYLSILMDEIFGKENKLITFHIQVRYTNKSLNEKNDFQPVMEYGLFYAKNKNKFIPNKPYVEYDISKFSNKIVELENPDKTIEMGGKRIEIFKPSHYIIESQKPSLSGLKSTWASGSVLKSNTSGKFFKQYLSKRRAEDGLNVLYKVYGIGDDGLGYRYFTGPKKEGAIRGQFYSGVPKNKIKDIQIGKAKKYKPIVNYYDFSGDVGNIRQEGGVPLNSGKKPEKLLSMLIDITTQENDLVLDPFAGSGTTAATCLKKHRKFLTIEQIDSQVELIIKRLCNVTNGDKTGISEKMKWQGGGSFIYAELMNKSQNYIEEIQKATNENDLVSVYQNMKRMDDIDFKVDINEFERLLVSDKESTLKDKKRELIKLVDKNQLYYNFKNINDVNVRNKIQKNDYEFNESFYSSKNEKN